MCGRVGGGEEEAVYKWYSNGRLPLTGTNLDTNARAKEQNGRDDRTEWYNQWGSYVRINPCCLSMFAFQKKGKCANLSLLQRSTHNHKPSEDRGRRETVGPRVWLGVACACRYPLLRRGFMGAWGVYRRARKRDNSMRVFCIVSS